MLPTRSNRTSLLSPTGHPNCRAIAYTEAFVEIAVSRGWQRENAETWPPEIADEAFIEAYRYE
jgi:hypothetical protein